METNKKEPAFPMLDPNGNYTQYGFSKREYMATLAMQGFIASMDTNTTALSDMHKERVAQLAVKYADALILELNKPKGE